MASNKKKYEITSVARQGVERFVSAKHIQLTTQHRSEDEKHTDLLNRMSAGECICSSDLEDYQELSPEDTDFQFAAIVTPVNTERHEFNHKIQSTRWAKKYKCCSLAKKN